MRERLVLTDGGLETTLVFHEGVELPHFAAFPLLDSPAGREVLRRYFARFFDVAREHRAAFQLDTPTWRANRDWGERLGYDRRRAGAREPRRRHVRPWAGGRRA
jgi:homocysteine S-methyltransferase